MLYKLFFNFVVIIFRFVLFCSCLFAIRIFSYFAFYFISIVLDVLGCCCYFVTTKFLLAATHVSRLLLMAEKDLIKTHCKCIPSCRLFNLWTVILLLFVSDIVARLAFTYSTKHLVCQCSAVQCSADGMQWKCCMWVCVWVCVQAMHIIQHTTYMQCIYKQCALHTTERTKCITMHIFHRLLWFNVVQLNNYDITKYSCSAWALHE